MFSQVIKGLSQDSKRTHALAEIAYFKRWFLDATEQEQEQTRTLLKNGQLEIVNGGWIQNDEALPYYDDMIDQIMIGHQFLKENFDYIPNVSFNVDNFGHSSALAAFYSQMGFNAYLVARHTTEDLETKKRQKKLELLWEPEFDTGVFKDSIFTHI